MLEPEALVGEAAARGVGLLAISDHDTTDGVDSGLSAASNAGVEVWSAVELSCDVASGEVHMLGYFIDHTLGWFQALLSRLRDGRARRAEQMVERLAALGVPVDYRRVQTLAGRGAVGRPHVARAMVEAGHVRTVSEAFDRFIGRHGPAYVERVKITPAQAVGVIRSAGGLAVLAHPGWSQQDGLIGDLVGVGLDGVEVYYPDHTHAQVEHLLGTARRHGLLVTGGTDFHGGGLATDVPLGSQHVPDAVVAPLRVAAAARRPSDQPPDLNLGVE